MGKPRGCTEHGFHEYIAQPSKVSARDKQVGGNHYKGGTMQPVDVIDAFGLNFYEGSALKYLLRWRKKNGVEDLQKCVHYLEMLIEREQKNDDV